MSQRIPAKTFYFIRHGRTEANAQGLMSGGAWDVELTAEGIAEARGAKDLLSLLEPKVSVLCVSPLKRAQDTATFLNEDLGLERHTFDGLKEWLVGEWEGKPWIEVPNPFTSSEDPPGGESRL